MDLYALNEAFYIRQMMNPMSSGQVALWHALVRIANKSRWPDWFTVAGMTLVQLSGLSISGVKKARNELKQRGLIDFRSNGTKASSYKITIQESSQDSIRNSSQDSSRNSIRNSSALIIQNKNKIVSRTREDNDDDELLAISDTMNAAFDAAEGIGLKGGAAIEKANRLAADYSAEWLLEAIRRASQAPKDAWCWRYIEGILRRWKQNGGIDAERAPTTEQPKKTRKVREWVYIGGERKLWEHEVPV